MAVDGGDRRALHFGQALEHLLAAAQCIADRAFRVERGELADVGAGDETGELGRTDDQALGRIEREAFEDRVEFEQHVLRQRIHAFAGAVEAEHDDPVGCGFGAPMLEAQSVETSEHAGPSVGVC